RIAVKRPTWLPRHAGQVCAWEIVWWGAQKSGTYVLVAYQARDGGLFVGCGCHEDKQYAAQQAMLQVWRRIQRFEQVCHADEPLLDTLHEQRLWGYATDPELAHAALAFLRARETQQAGALPLPD